MRLQDSHFVSNQNFTNLIKLKLCSRFFYIIFDQYLISISFIKKPVELSGLSVGVVSGPVPGCLVGKLQLSPRQVSFAIE